MYSKKERERYNEYRKRICEACGLTENEYNGLRRIRQRLHEIYENNCNEGMTEEAYEYLTGIQESKAEKVTGKHGLHIYYQTDPRGATIYVDKKPIPNNNYTSASCIY